MLVLEASADDRRRHAHRGAHAARLPPRRVLGDPPARASARPSCAAAARASTGSSCVHPERARWPTRSTTAARSRCTARSTRPRPASARDGARLRSAHGPARARLGRARRTSCSARRSGRRATRCRAARFGLLGAALAPPACARALRGRAGAGAAGGHRRPLDAAARRAPATAAFALVLLMLGHARRLAGSARRLAGDRRRDGVATCGRSAARSRPAARCARSTSFRGARAVLLRRHAATAPRDRRRRAAARATAARSRRFRYGPGVFKLDYALDGPVPWTAEACRARGHGARRRHARGDRRGGAEVARGGHPQRPVRAGRPAEPRSTRPRAPAGAHTLWAYCHVPNGSTRRHDRRRSSARSSGSRPGFRDLVLARATRWARPSSRRENPNYIGGDINGGRPTCASSSRARRSGPHPYTTPNPRHLHLLVVDASRRRRARHVRVVRRSCSAPRRLALMPGARLRLWRTR